MSAAILRLTPRTFSIQKRPLTVLITLGGKGNPATKCDIAPSVSATKITVKLLENVQPGKQKIDVRVGGEISDPADITIKAKTGTDGPAANKLATKVQAAAKKSKGGKA
jgi:hypothetical protein